MKAYPKTRLEVPAGGLCGELLDAAQPELAFALAVVGSMLAKEGLGAALHDDLQDACVCLMELATKAAELPRVSSVDVQTWMRREGVI